MILSFLFFRILAISFVLFVVVSKNLFATIDPTLLKWSDELKLKKGYEYLHPFNGVLLAQGMIANICNYPLADKDRKNYTYPTEHFVASLFNTAGSDIPNYLKITPLASQFAPFLGISTIGAILKVLKEANEKGTSGLQDKLKTSIKADNEFKQRVENGKKEVNRVKKLMDDCKGKLLVMSKGEEKCVDKKTEVINTAQVSNLTDVNAKNNVGNVPANCQDQEKKYTQVKNRMYYDNKSLNNFVKRLEFAWTSERTKDAKYPKYFTEQALLALAWLVDDADELGNAGDVKNKKKKILEIYQELDVLEKKLTKDDLLKLASERYSKDDYYKLSDPDTPLANNFNDHKSDLTFLGTADPLYNSAIPEISYQNVDYKLKNRNPPKSVKFADCMDSSILNFLTIALRNGDGIDPNLLSKLQAKPELNEFFTKHSSIVDISTNSVTHNDWVQLIEEVPGVEYVNSDGYEVDTKIQNIFTLMDHLFFTQTNPKPLAALKNNEKKLDKLCDFFYRDGFNLDWKMADGGEKRSLNNKERGRIQFTINGNDAFIWVITPGHSEIKRTGENKNKSWKNNLQTLLADQNAPSSLTSMEIKLLGLIADQNKIPKDIQVSKSEQRLLQYLLPVRSIEYKMELLKSVINDDSNTENRISSIDRIVKTFPLDEHSKIALLEAYLLRANEFKESINEIEKEFPDKERLISEAASSGMIEIVKYLLDQDSTLIIKAEKISFGSPLLTLAAKNGHFEVVKYFVDKKGVDPAAKENEAFREAARYGHLEVLKFLIDKKGVDPAAEKNAAFRAAAENGHLEVLKFFINKLGVDPAAEKNAAFREAAANGHLEVLKFLIDKGVNPTVAEKNEIFQVAAANGHLEVLKLLIDQGFKPTAVEKNAAFREAAANAHLEVLKFLIDKGVNPTVAEKNEIFQEAARRSHLEVLKFLIDQGFKPTAVEKNAALREAVKGRQLEVLRFFIDDQGVDPVCNEEVALRVFERAAKEGELELLKFFIDKKFVDYSTNESYPARLAAYNAATEAARKDHLEVVKFLFEKEEKEKKEGQYNYLSASNAFQAAFSNNGPEVLKFLFDKKDVDDHDKKRALVFAASKGYLEILKFLIDKGVDPTVDENMAFVYAVEKGRIEVVKLLLSDPRVDPHADKNKTIEKAISEKDVEMLMLIKNHPKTKSEIKERIDKLLK